KAFVDSAASRRKCRTAWIAWWQINESKLDLGRLKLELNWADPARLAREVTVQCLQAIASTDCGLFKDTTEIPFYADGRIFQTRRQMDLFVAKRGREKFAFEIKRVGTV